jgi:DNA-binding transcriptional ArsR family regulator
VRIAGRADDLAAGDGDGVRHVTRLDDLAPRDLNHDRLHRVGTLLGPLWRDWHTLGAIRSVRSGRDPGPGPFPHFADICEWSGNPVCSAIIDRFPDYELDDVLTIEEPERIRAGAHPTRGRICALLNQRAASTTELATALGIPKGTVGHHLKVLEKAELIRVVRTRKVRALTEKYYGRVARLFVLKSLDAGADELRSGAITAMMLRQGAEEAIAGADDKSASGLIRVRLAPKDLLRFQKRLNRLLADFHGSADPTGDLHVLTYALFRSGTDLPPRKDGGA